MSETLPRQTATKAVFTIPLSLVLGTSGLAAQPPQDILTTVESASPTTGEAQAIANAHRVSGWRLGVEMELARLAGLEQDWNGYGAEPPGSTALANAKDALDAVEETAFVPSRIAPSAEGGVAMYFERGDRFAIVEFLNDGAIAALTGIGKSGPREAWDVGGEPEDLHECLESFDEFLGG